MRAATKDKVRHLAPVTCDVCCVLCHVLCANASSVRGDLIRILKKLDKRRNKFDHVLIETTGEGAVCCCFVAANTVTAV